MAIVEKEIWINCTPRAAFELHADHANRAAWHEHVISAEMISPLLVRNIPAKKKY